MARIAQDRAWLTLTRIAAAEIIAIDDLISASTSTVLTLAYARALRAAPRLTETAFVFLVSDYVVADGALGNLLRRLDSGADAVLTGNLSALSEATLPALGERVEGGVLSIPPRDLIGLALDHMPIQTRLGMVGTSVQHDADANRVFWPAGTDALVGRLYLLHMAAIRPKVDTFVIAAPSDYGLVEELVPSGRVDVVDDSDEFAVVEVVAAESVPRAITSGAPSPARIAASVRRWATARQRRNAETPILFHSGEIASPETAAAIAQSARFVADVSSRLGTDALPERHHPYWIGQLAHHRRTLIDPQGMAGIPAIVGYDPDATVSGRGYRPGELRRWLLGDVPNVRPWHPRWPDLFALRRLLRKLPAQKRVLLVGGQPEPLRRLVPTATVLSFRDLLVDDHPSGFDVALLVRTQSDPLDSRAAERRVWQLLSPDGVQMTCDGEVFADSVARSGLNQPIPGASVFYATRCGRLRERVQTAMMQRALTASRTSGWELAASLIPLAVLALCSLVINLATLALSGPSSHPASSVLATVRRHAASTAAAGSRPKTASSSKGHTALYDVASG